VTGKSIVPEPASPVECKEGGTKLKVEGTSGSSHVCNGSNGSPWTAGGTLPSKATETGAYFVTSENGTGPVEGYAMSAVSFNVPLASGLAEGQIIIVTPSSTAEQKENCENPEHAGVASVSNPEAKPGFLCVYQTSANNMKEAETIVVDLSFANIDATSASGALIAYAPTAAGAFVYGTWAVTAP
jgi:hypothetical protein